MRVTGLMSIADLEFGSKGILLYVTQRKNEGACEGEQR